LAGEAKNDRIKRPGNAEPLRGLGSNVVLRAFLA
jgi:hypothetical protein